jgi:hypothetical protein
MLPPGAGGEVLEETISLYLELKPGQKPDMEVVGLAAAAFAEAVKEIAHILDPGMEVRLEFQNASESSLSLNAVFKTLKNRDGQRGTIIGVIIGTSLAFVCDVRQWSSAKLLDHYFSQEKRQQLSEEDITRIALTCKNVADGKLAKEPIQRVYKQLERDNVIESVGTITQPNTKPPAPVSRADFNERSGVSPIVHTSPWERSTPSTEKLTLIRPVLLNSPRPWRFDSPLGEIPYRMDDKKFLKDVLDGKAHLAMKKGIQISAKVETDEQLHGGVWVVTLRKIIKVIRVHKKPPADDLFSQSKKSKASTKKKRDTKRPKRRSTK